MSKHVHAEVIHAYADGAEIEFLRDGAWKLCVCTPAFDPSKEYRVKPPVPVRAYPESRMNGVDLMMVYSAIPRATVESTMFAVANAALRHAIDNFQVVETGVVEKLCREAAYLFECREAARKGYSSPNPQLVDRTTKKLFEDALAGKVEGAYHDYCAREDS